MKRLRRWQERNQPGVVFVFRKYVNYGPVHYKPGDNVPPELLERQYKLHNLFESGKVQMLQDEEVARRAAQNAETSEEPTTTSPPTDDPPADPVDDPPAEGDPLPTAEPVDDPPAEGDPLPTAEPVDDPLPADIPLDDSEPSVPTEDAEPQPVSVTGKLRGGWYRVTFGNGDEKSYRYDDLTDAMKAMVPPDDE